MVVTSTLPSKRDPDVKRQTLSARQHELSCTKYCLAGLPFTPLSELAAARPHQQPLSRLILPCWPCADRHRCGHRSSLARRRLALSLGPAFAVALDRLPLRVRQLGRRRHGVRQAAVPPLGGGQRAVDLEIVHGQVLDTKDAGRGAAEAAVTKAAPDEQVGAHLAPDPGGHARRPHAVPPRLVLP